MPPAGGAYAAGSRCVAGVASGDVAISGGGAFRALYSKSGGDDSRTYFNPVQTQAFSSLYESDQPVMLAAPGGCGALA